MKNHLGDRHNCNCEHPRRKKNEKRRYTVFLNTRLFCHYEERCLICFHVTAAVLVSQTNSQQLNSILTHNR